MAKTSTVKEATDLKRCECGCGAVVKNMFASGHDQRHKGNLLRAFDGGSTEAADELVKRGWRTATELEDRRLNLEAKAAKKAKIIEQDAEAAD